MTIHIGTIDYITKHGEACTMSIVFDPMWCMFLAVTSKGYWLASRYNLIRVFRG